MPNIEEFSEFDGAGVMPNTVYPKGSDALTASDKLRLISITGQEEDSRAPVNPYFWQGEDFPTDQAAIEADRRARLQRQRAIVREQRDRYKESQY